MSWHGHSILALGVSERISAFLAQGSSGEERSRCWSWNRRREDTPRSYNQGPHLLIADHCSQAQQIFIILKLMLAMDKSIGGKKENLHQITFIPCLLQRDELELFVLMQKPSPLRELWLLKTKHVVQRARVLWGDWSINQYHFQSFFKLSSSQTFKPHPFPNQEPISQQWAATSAS